MPLWINGATGENCAANPWMFVPLLAGTWIVMTFRSGERAWIGRKVVNALGPLGVAGLIFVAGLLGRPDPTAMDYYARGSVYLYLGRYEQAYSEMQFALAANPDPNTRALIQKGISDLADRMKQ